MLKIEQAAEYFATMDFYFLFTLLGIQTRATQQLLDATVVIYFEF